MLVEQFPKTTLEMYKPPWRTSRQTEEAYAQQQRILFGEAGQQLAQALIQGTIKPYQLEDFRGRIDVHFFNAYSDIYRLARSITPESAYLNAQTVALEVVRDCTLKAFPDYEDDFFRNEVALKSPSPTDLYYYMVLPYEGPLGAYEVRRHFLLTNTAAAMDARSGNGSLAIQLSDINRLLDAELFKPGSGRQTTIYADHDQQTNTVYRVTTNKPEESLRSNAITRKHTLTLREIEGIGLVQTRVRQKDLVSAVEKLLSKAATNGGVLDPESVNDYMGFTFIGLGGEGYVTPETQLDYLESRLVDVLNSYRSLVEIRPDHVVDRDRGQAEVRFRRLQIFLEDQTVPLEFMLFDAVEYLNQSFEIGVMDPQTRFYTGRSHKMYEYRRTYPIMPFVYPEDIYQLDAQEALLCTMHEIADQARKIGTRVRSLPSLPNALIRKVGTGI